MATKKATSKRQRPNRLQRFANAFYNLAPWKRASLFGIAFALIASSGYMVIGSYAYTTRSANYCLANDIIVSQTRSSHHDCVRTLQVILLNSTDVYRACNTSSIIVDQDFGPITASKLKCFQRTSFAAAGPIKDDGIAGNDTFTKLKKVCWYNHQYSGSPNAAWCGGTDPYNR